MLSAMQRADAEAGGMFHPTGAASGTCQIFNAKPKPTETCSIMQCYKNEYYYRTIMYGLYIFSYCNTFYSHA